MIVTEQINNQGENASELSYKETINRNTEKKIPEKPQEKQENAKEEKSEIHEKTTKERKQENTEKKIPEKPRGERQKNTEDERENPQENTKTTAEHSPGKGTKKKGGETEQKEQGEEFDKKREVQEKDQQHQPDQVLGGQWTDNGCVSDLELDQALGHFSNIHLPARTFYDFRVGKLEEAEFSKRIRKKVTEEGQCAIVVHLRHHWLLAVIQDGITKIFDSAPSFPVRKDLTRITEALKWRLDFVPGPRQTRGSNECGIFVIFNLFRWMAGLPTSSPPLPRTLNLQGARR